MNRSLTGFSPEKSVFAPGKSVRFDSDRNYSAYLNHEPRRLLLRSGPSRALGGNGLGLTFRDGRREVGRSHDSELLSQENARQAEQKETVGVLDHGRKSRGVIFGTGCLQVCPVAVSPAASWG